MALSMNASGACLPTADNAFGPTVTAPCRDGFDFTFTFEQYFFTIAPCALVLVAAPPRLYFLSRLQPTVDGKSFKLIKLVRMPLFS
jgi:ATP-binding cassette subfamily C (CFTR/MRP) protein 1